MARYLRLAVGSNLLSIRTAQGLSQERFAERYGLDRSWVGHVENAKRNLTLDSVETLAGKLQVGVFDLVKRPADDVPSPPLAEEKGDEEAGGETG